MSTLHYGHDMTTETAEAPAGIERDPADLMKALLSHKVLRLFCKDPVVNYVVALLVKEGGLVTRARLRYGDGRSHDQALATLRVHGFVESTQVPKARGEDGENQDAVRLVFPESETEEVPF